MHFDALFLQFFSRRVQAKRGDPGIHQSPGTMDCRIKSGDDAVQEHHRTIRDAALELTRYQRAGAICIDPEPARASSPIQNHTAKCAVADQSPLSDIAACCASKDRVVLSGLFDDRGLDVRVLNSPC
jgi:hypothetical protein